MEHLSFKLKVAMPFRLDLTAWALRRRSNNIMDRWVDGSWRRVLVFKEKPIEVAVNQELLRDNTMLQVSLAGLRLAESSKKDVIAILEKCLGIKKDLHEFYQFAKKDDTLNSLVNLFLGLKPPRFPTVFEAAVNGITCQQISLNSGIILLNRLTSSYGLTIKSSENNISYAFPRPEDLSKLSPNDFRKFGFSRQKGRAIIELAQAIMANQVDLEQLEKLDNAEALTRLCQLRGVGRWTGEYILLRGLGRLDVFPAGDVGGRRGLQKWLNLNKPLDYGETQNIIAKWKPYGGLIYFHLLLNRLVKEGYLSEKTNS